MRWVDEYPAKDALDTYKDTFLRLYHMAGKYSATDPLTLRFSPEAQGAYRRHCEGIQNRCRRGGLSPAFESHLGKMPKTVASLALLFELCECDGVPFDIGLPATEMAVRFALLLESHAGRIYGMEGTAADAGAQLIFERRKRLPAPFSFRDVDQKQWAGLGNPRMVGAAIARLVETHNLRGVSEPSGPGGGRPTTRYEWHPAHDFEK